jgi:hypothetical protein
MSDTERAVKQLWQDFVNAENAMVSARMRLLAKKAPLVETLRQSLGHPSERGTALRLLLILDISVSQALFHELIYQASWGSCDIELCREVIYAIPKPWLMEHIESELWPIVENGGEAECHCLAQLLDELEFSALLSKLVDYCLQSSNPDILEVGDDYKR